MHLKDKAVLYVHMLVFVLKYVAVVFQLAQSVTSNSITDI